MTMKGDRTVMLNGDAVTILTPGERAGKLGQGQAQASIAHRMLANGQLAEAEVALIEARAVVQILLRDDVARKEHRRLARAAK